MLIVSPFRRGGLVSSDRFDHTSVLRFLETRFGAEVPNLSAWPRAAVGDLTRAFNFAAPGPTPVAVHARARARHIGRMRRDAIDTCISNVLSEA
jgi:phospholipase C